MSEQRPENSGEKPPGKTTNGIWLSIVLGLGVSIALFAYGDIGEATEALVGFRWSYIPAILALTFLNYLLRFYKWDYYLRNIGIKIKARDSMAIFLSGLAMSVTPAKLGEVFKSYLLKRLNGTEVSRSVPVVFAERATDVLGLLILAVVSFSTLQYGKEVLVIVLALLLALTAAIQSRGICTKLLQLSESLPSIGRLSSSLRMGYESAHVLFEFKKLMVATAISVVSWGFECVAMYLVLAGLGGTFSLLLGTFVFSFSSLVGAVSIIPGGLVAAEGSSVGLLMLAGASKPVAASATVIIRVCTLWFGVALGLTTMCIRHKSL